MSIVIDSSFAETPTTNTLGYFTGLQKGTVLKSSEPTQSPSSSLSYYFIYSSDEPNQELGLGVTTDASSLFLQSGAAEATGLSSLSQLSLSGSASSSSSSHNSISTSSSSNGASNLNNHYDSNKKLTILVGVMVGLSALLTSL